MTDVKRDAALMRVFFRHQNAVFVVDFDVQPFFRKRNFVLEFYGQEIGSGVGVGARPKESPIGSVGLQLS
jgi:hypothetical protein